MWSSVPGSEKGSQVAVLPLRWPGRAWCRASRQATLGGLISFVADGGGHTSSLGSLRTLGPSQKLRAGPSGLHRAGEVALR